MARWGKPWGLTFPWGVHSGTGPEDICAIAESRFLLQMGSDEGERVFRDLVCCLVAPLGHMLDILDEVEGAFDIETAVGDQQDKIGVLIGLPREGFSDDRYRVFQQIQTDLLLSAMRGEANRTGSGNNLLTICRRFIGDGVADPVVLLSMPPKDFILSIPGVTVEEAPLLIRFLTIAIDAETLGHVGFVLGDASLWDSTEAAITNGGIWQSTVTPISPAAVWGSVQTIGDKVG